MTARTELLPHQVPAVEKLARITVGALFMDMGTGKSRVVVELALRRRARLSRVVWVCPVSLMETVRREIHKHVEGADVHVFDDRTTSSNIPDAFWHVVGIESLSSSDRVTLALSSIVDEKTMVIVDESTTIKGDRAKRTRRVTAISDRARYRLILTGTPTAQGVQDLFSQLRFLSPKILGYRSWYSFAANHLEFAPGKKRPVRAHNTDLLAAKIAPYTYHVSKDECLDLPSKLHETVTFWMTSEQQELYDRAKSYFLEETFLAGDPREEEAVVYRMFTALQQIACGHWTEYPPLKDRKRGEAVDPRAIHEVSHRRIEMLLDVLNRIPRGERVVIWAKHMKCVAAISKAVEASGRPVALHTGQQTRQERTASLDAFRSGERPILVSTAATGGYGLTLTEAAWSIYYANEFSYARRAQSEDRLHRIGQTRPVTYVDLECAGTIDTLISRVLSDRTTLAKTFRSKIAIIRDKKGRMNALKELMNAR